MSVSQSRTLSHVGSECVWIIDPEKRVAWTINQENPAGPTEIRPEGLLRIRDTPIELKRLFRGSESQYQFERVIVSMQWVGGAVA